MTNLQRTGGIASGWGLAEATFFFIVPDVMLSWYALQNRRQAAWACLFALMGALFGGVLIWFWGRIDVDAGRSFFEQIPAINAALITKVQIQLEESGLVALFVGPLQGTPYKLYALEAANLGYGLAVFLLVSVPSRLLRFVVVTVVIGSVGEVLKKRFRLRSIQIAHITCWTLFYAWYFWIMSTL